MTCNSCFLGTSPYNEINTFSIIVCERNLQSKDGQVNIKEAFLECNPVRE